jgi:hypothetical protein
MDEAQVRELLYQALETELGGVQVYELAVKCAVNSDLKEEWEKYLSETREHVEIVTQVLEDLDMDPEVETDGRKSCDSRGRRFSTRWRWPSGRRSGSGTARCRRSRGRRRNQGSLQLGADRQDR